MELKDFLKSCPIGKAVAFRIDARPRDEFLLNRGGGAGFTHRQSTRASWVVPLPRIFIFCNECGGTRNFNPAPSGMLEVACLDVGTGPYIVPSNRGGGLEFGRHIDQFLRYICGDCMLEEKKYSLAVEIQDVHPSKIEVESGSESSKPSVAEVSLQIAKFGEIPKPTKPINSKIKRLIKDEWELYRKGADDEAAGNGIGAFAYYRRVVEESRGMLVDAICTAAAKLNVSETDIAQIRATKESKNFVASVRAVDHLLPSDLKFNGQNALTVLYGPLSEGLHEKSDEDCLVAATDIRILLDALGEKLEHIIDQEDRIQDALKGLRDISDDRSDG